MNVRSKPVLIVAGVVALTAALGIGIVAAQGSGSDEAAGATEETKQARYEEYQERFTEALGVTVEDLEAAMTQVALDRIDEAATSATISAERAAAAREAIESGEAPGRHFGFGAYFLAGGHAEGFAEALGVTVEEIEAAKQEVALALLDEAVAAGTISAERAEAVREAIESGETPGKRFGSGHSFRKGGNRVTSGEERERFAEALGVTAEDLDAAMTQVALHQIEEAVAAGTISEKRAAAAREVIESGEARGKRFGFGHSFRKGGNRVTSGEERERFAEALGVTVEDLDAARTQVALDRIDEAVAAGTISAERAEAVREAIESGEAFERGRFGHKRGGPRHHRRTGYAEREPDGGGEETATTE